MNKRNDNLVIIFAKKPELGKTKTRIAAETSFSFALEFTIACFSDLLNKIRGSNFYDLVVATDSHEDAAWFEKKFNVQCFPIENSHKIERISDKFNYLFGTLTKKFKYKKIVLIPMDMPFLTEEEIIMAFVQMDNYRYVVGPETDGGVYLIGIKQPYLDDVFENVPWSTPNSCNKLVDNMTQNSYKNKEEFCYKLKYKTDLNTFQLVLGLKEEIALNCPNLFLLLDRNGYYIPNENRFVDYDSLSIRVPIVACLVERIKTNNEKVELLIQTRNKPAIDKTHSGLIEIPGGLMDKYCPVEEMAIKEVFEETGVKCEIIGFTPNGERKRQGELSSLTARPFCCVQQIEGNRLYFGVVYLARYISGKPRENAKETKDPRWVPILKLKDLVEKKPKSIFSLYLPVLKNYLNFRQNV